MNNTTPARLAGVSKTYGSIVALSDVSLTIEPGELVALLGPNGAGKTTAVKLPLGLLSPGSGVARVFGANPREAANRMRTGAMLQIARVPETLRVREHIGLFSSYYPKPMPYRDVIDAAGLRGVEERKFADLSGGQRQRLLFALAICGDPDLLILDEPTVGLDIEARRGMWAQIRVLLGRGKSVLLTTHYLEEADALADRVIVIDRGTIIAEGTPAQIKQRAAGKRIRCRTELTVDAVRAIPFVTTANADDDALVIGTPASDVVVRELLARDPALSNLEITSAGLEEAFLALTGSGR
ncbi:MAG TPA: ABC transporter ATP-binding protein [Thermoanaerobaculia bacterium]|nr:ABC transporter ATP-binding protein [Thermoanaerobaculia bacterium]